MEVPSELKTLHVTGTIWEVTRIAGAGEPFVGADRSIVKLMEVVALFEA